MDWTLLRRWRGPHGHCRAGPGTMKSFTELNVESYYSEAMSHSNICQMATWMCSDMPLTLNSINRTNSVQKQFHFSSCWIYFAFTEKLSVIIHFWSNSHFPFVCYLFSTCAKCPRSQPRLQYFHSFLREDGGFLA